MAASGAAATASSTKAGVAATGRPAASHSTRTAVSCLLRSFTMHTRGAPSRSCAKHTELGLSASPLSIPGEDGVAFVWRIRA